jgi:hypothetical protein
MKQVHLEPGQDLQDLLRSLDAEGCGEILDVAFRDIQFTGRLPRFKRCDFFRCDFTWAENLEIEDSVCSECSGILERLTIVHDVRFGESTAKN